MEMLILFAWALHEPKFIVYYVIYHAAPLKLIRHTQVKNQPFFFICAKLY